jgi:hypothetical protein
LGGTLGVVVVRGERVHDKLVFDIMHVRTFVLEECISKNMEFHSFLLGIILGIKDLFQKFIRNQGVEVQLVNDEHTRIFTQYSAEMIFIANPKQKKVLLE